VNEGDLLLARGSKVRVVDPEGKEHVGKILRYYASRKGIVYSVLVDGNYTVEAPEKDVRRFDEAG